MSMKPTINTNLNKKKLSQFLVVLSLTLTGCSTASESFDSQATQGVGSKSISQVNAMIDKGQIEGIKGDNESDNVIGTNTDTNLQSRNNCPVRSFGDSPPTRTTYAYLDGAVSRC